MLQTLKTAWKTTDIRNKILFTLFILLLYRLGTVIPVPFVDAHNFASSFSGTILDHMNLLSGGALGTATLFALGVSPYINSSIIIQLLSVVFPRLAELAKNDKAKMNLITRITTVILALVTAIGYYFLLRNNSALTKAAMPGEGKIAWIYAVVIIACYCAGASVIMWLAERINEKGIGNGISLILFANIISSIPSMIYNLVVVTVDTYSYPDSAWLYALVSTLLTVILIAFIVASIIFVIWVTGSERKILVKYASRQIGRKMMSSQTQDLPIKLNMTGVMPVIFASSIVSLVPTILALCGVTASTKNFWGTLYNILGSDGVIYPITLFLLIIAFAYFYTQITFDPMEVANQIKAKGGVILGYRQGRPTADYIRSILGKVTLVGALFLGIVAVVPVIAGPHILQHIIEWILDGSAEAKLIEQYMADPTYSWYASLLDSQLAARAANITSSLTFGGTTLLIMVGVVLETYREIEAQLAMRNLKGLF